MVRRRGRAVLAVISLVAGCGDDDGGSTAADAAAPADAAGPPDAAAPDAALRAGLWYVMDSIRVPQTADQATQWGLDLDGDGRRDNALGGLLAAMHTSVDLQFASAQDELVGSGAILELVGIDAASLDDAASVPVLVSRGADLDGDAADNFSGAELFALVPLDGADGQLAGALAAGRVRAGPGDVPVQLAMVGVTPQVVPLRGVGGRLVANASGDGLAAGRLGAAFRDAEVDDVLIPALAAGIDSIVRRDCPGGPCEVGSQGEQLSVFFDENQDGMVPVEELRANSLIESTVGNPDLDLFDADGAFNPRMDGVKDALSLGLGFAAVGAAVAQ